MFLSQLIAVLGGKIRHTSP